MLFLNRYYAKGIRNSFGLAFDSLTGNLWDSENGQAMVMKSIWSNQYLTGSDKLLDGFLERINRGKFCKGDLIKKVATD